MNYEIPASVQAAARRGLELRKEYGRGGTSIGLQTARRLTQGGKASFSFLRRVSLYFPRHQGDRLDLDGRGGREVSNGYIAWLLWGGDPGRRWSEGIMKKLTRSRKAAPRRMARKAAVRKTTRRRTKRNPYAIPVSVRAVQSLTSRGGVFPISSYQEARNRAAEIEDQTGNIHSVFTSGGKYGYAPSSVLMRTPNPEGSFVGLENQSGHPLGRAEAEANWRGRRGGVYAVFRLASGNTIRRHLTHPYTYRDLGSGAFEAAIQDSGFDMTPSRESNPFTSGRKVERVFIGSPGSGESGLGWVSLMGAITNKRLWSGNRQDGEKLAAEINTVVDRLESGDYQLVETAKDSQGMYGISPWHVMRGQRSYGSGATPMDAVIIAAKTLLGWSVRNPEGGEGGDSVETQYYVRVYRDTSAGPIQLKAPDGKEVSLKDWYAVEGVGPRGSFKAKIHGYGEAVRDAYQTQANWKARGYQMEVYDETEGGGGSRMVNPYYSHQGQRSDLEPSEEAERLRQIYYNSGTRMGAEANFTSAESAWSKTFGSMNWVGKIDSQVPFTKDDAREAFVRGYASTFKGYRVQNPDLAEHFGGWTLVYQGPYDTYVANELERTGFTIKSEGGHPDGKIYTHADQAREAGQYVRTAIREAQSGRQSNPTVSGEGQGAYVVRSAGDFKKVKNLGWIIKNWRNIDHLRWESADKWSGIFRAEMKDGTTYTTPYASFEVFKNFINRPVFKGLPLYVNGKKVIVGDADFKALSRESNPSSMRVFSMSEIRQLPWYTGTFSKLPIARKRGQEWSKKYGSELEVVLVQDSRGKKVAYTLVRVSDLQALDGMTGSGGVKVNPAGPSWPAASLNVDSNSSKRDWLLAAEEAGYHWAASGAADESGVSNASVVRYGFIKWSNEFSPKTQRPPRGVTKPILTAMFRKGYKQGQQRGRRRNPESQAAELFEVFHGEPSKEEVVITTEIHTHDHLTALGRLQEIKVKTLTGRELVMNWKGEGDDVPYLSSSEDGRQLFIEGGNQTIDLAKIGMAGKEWLRDSMVIGELVEVTYRTRKQFHQFKLTDYYHKLGEETKVKPSLIYDSRSGLMSIAGGQYSVEDVGIKN